MRRLIKIGVYFTLLLTILALFYGCRNHDERLPRAENMTYYQENMAAIQPGVSYYPTASGQGLYSISLEQGLIYYTDVTTKKKIVCCGRGGCMHNSDECIAYYPGISLFAEYNGSWYVVQNKSSGIEIICADPNLNKKQVLYKADPNEGHVLDILGAIISHGSIWLSIGDTELSTDKCLTELRTVSLETGTETTVLSCQNNQTLRLLGVGVRQFAVQYSTSSFELSFEDFLKQNPTLSEYEAIEHYYELMSNQTLDELCIYDATSYELSQILTDSDHGFEYSVDPKICEKDRIVYQVENTLYIYDLSNQEITELETPDNPIKNYWQCDNRIFYITVDSKQIARFYYTDLEEKKTTQLQNSGNTDYTVFSIQCVLADYFVGIYDGENCLLLKDDYYEEQYSRSVKLP